MSDEKQNKDMSYEERVEAKKQAIYDDFNKDHHETYESPLSKKAPVKNYMVPGMVIGLLVGLVIYAFAKNGYSIALGYLVGMMVGLCIKKKN